jgi:hypothetical protein
MIDFERNSIDKKVYATKKETNIEKISF